MLRPNSQKSTSQRGREEGKAVKKCSAGFSEIRPDFPPLFGRLTDYLTIIYMLLLLLL